MQHPPARHRWIAAATLSLSLLLATQALRADPAATAPTTPATALARMPVKEVTVFKDGHAFVLHEGSLPTNADGNVTTDYLPTPVFGTFWPYSADKNVKLAATIAAQRRVSIERTALTVQELIEANPGAEVSVTEMSHPAAAGVAPVPSTYTAKIIGVPTQSSEEQDATNPPNGGDPLPIKAGIVMLQTTDGTRAVSMDRIVDVSFRRDYQRKVARDEMRNLLTYKLDWPEGKPKKEAAVGMLYVQKGLRWVPEYRVTLDGKGQASVRLQATLINELTDLNDVTMNLVIGVPSFAFKDAIDPMSLQQTAAQLSVYFQNGSRTGLAMSNSSIMMNNMGNNFDNGAASQVPGMQAAGQPVPDALPEMGNSGKAEDLFIYTLKHVTLAKGQRMVVPVTESMMPYKDVYTLDIPLAPPPEVWRGNEGGRDSEFAKLMNAPKVKHKVRVTNSTGSPMTTAPALVLLNDRLISQGLSTYTAPGAAMDLDLSTAVDVRVKKAEHEAKRVPNAQTWEGNAYYRVDLAGSITLTDFGPKPIEVEVTRHVFGEVTDASAGGKFEGVNLFEEGESGGLPGWNQFAWPNWWRHLNGIGKITWTVKLEPGKEAVLEYGWRYYWR